jgi:hypothetical protein
MESFTNKWWIQAIKFENRLSKQWQFIGSGKNRRVWHRNNVVLKIAYTNNGIKDNCKEYQIYLKYHKITTIYAPCRLIQPNLLMMRYISSLDDLDPVQASLIPNWALDLNDGPQVGIYKNNIVIYDYAEEYIYRT